MSVCVISQPRLLPGLHYLHRMMVADVFVIFDTVQFTPRHEENRARLKTPAGAQWLTIPMRQTSREQLILDTLIDHSQTWQRKAIGTLSQHYAKTPYYETYSPEINQILETPHTTLAELDRASWEPALRLLGITCEFVYASDLPIRGKGPEALLSLCHYLGVDTYLSGAFGREYLDVAEFNQQGVGVLFHEYTYPIYPQRYGDFVPYLSYVDMLFNVGLDRETVLAGGRCVPAQNLLASHV